MPANTHVDFNQRHHLSVCPHDTAKNLVGWYLLNNYLQNRLAARIHFEPHDNFLREREHVLGHEHHIVYANPYSAFVFARQRGFTPVARPVGVFDETVLIARKPFERRALSSRPRVASATDKLVVHALGLQLLERIDLDPTRAEFVFKGNHLNAAKAVITGDAELGFVFNETWDGMSATAKEPLQVLARSEDGRASHVFMVGPAWAHRADEIRDLLCGMAQDPKGREILADLHFTGGFEAVPATAFDRLDALVPA